MAPDIQMTADNGIIRVTYRGDVEYEATTEMLRVVGQMAADKQIRMLLFDIRDANYRYYHFGAIKHAEEGPGLGIDHSFRIAFLGAEDNPMLGYIEAVTVNRGFLVKAFSGEADALAWLRSAP